MRTKTEHTNRRLNAGHQPMSVRTVKTNVGIGFLLTFKIINTRTGETVEYCSTIELAHARAETLARAYIEVVKARIRNAKVRGLL